MNTMMSLIYQVLQFLRDEEGSELVEWALVAGLIIVVGAGAFIAIGGDVGTIFGLLENSMDQAATAAQGS
jgi:pilus assembly protein Flp/PilA